MLYKNINDENRQAWLKKTLANLPAGFRILDAGAGELRNRPLCTHLTYVSQDFCQYKGQQDSVPNEGLQNKFWDTSSIDLVCDISTIPLPDSSFDAILCSEVLEHVPEPTHALDEFVRLLKPGGKLILTAPFASSVHMAPYYFYSGFSKYWYEHHLTQRGLRIETLVSNGDWYALLKQEITRLGGLERQRGNWGWLLAYVYGLLGLVYFKLRSKIQAEDLSCFGWHCVGVKVKNGSK